MNKDKDIVYFNIQRYYDGETTFDFNENRVNEVLSNPSDYELAVTRFSIPSIGIPILFNVPFRYSIVLEYDSDRIELYINFPQNSDDPKPLYPPHFAVWSYSEICEGINDTLKQLHDTMKTTYPSFPPTIPCKITYDSRSSLFSLFASTDYSASNVKLFFNDALYGILNGFQTKQESFPPILSPYYQILIKDNGNNQTTYGGSGYIMIQNFSTTEQMSTLDSIIFETNSIPVQPELLGSQTNESRIVISDFYITRSINNRYNIQYFPKGPLLYTDLTTSYPLHRLDLKLSWIDNDGKIHNLIGDSGSPIDIKLSFRKKLDTRLEEVNEDL